MGFDKQERCMGCMQPLAWDGRCSCGFDRKSYSADSHYLPLGAVLKKGDYMVGKVLGEGGFGITYMGFDRNLLSRIAIKEYYPSGFAGRDVSNGNYNVCPYEGDDSGIYKNGLDAFLREARTLAQFSGLEGIVKVRYLFQENQTAYIVMEYVEGKSVKKHVQEYGRIQPGQVWKMMEQPIQALQAVHEKQLVHRDVSPDNLMIGHKGKITLIDFGSARSSNVMDEKTRTTICKQGFSALEQYSKEGKQGPWTDVYSICATMYYMLTGIVPKNSTERIVDDMVVPLSQMDDIALEREKKDALMAGMAVKSDERIQNMEALYSALYRENLSKPIEPPIVFVREEEDVPARKDGLGEKAANKRQENYLTAILGEVLKDRERKRKYNRKRRFFGKAVGGIFAIVFLVIFFWGMRGYIHIDAGIIGNAGRADRDDSIRYAGEKAGSTPQVSSEPSGNAIKPVSETDGTLQASGIPKMGNIPQASREPQLSNIPQVNSTNVPLASGMPQGTVSKAVKMPEVAGVKKAIAVERIRKKGLRCRVVLRNHSSIAAGRVIRASTAAGKTVEKGKKIILYVSKGRKVAATPRPTIVPRQTPVPLPVETRGPVATKKPSVTKKPDKQDNNMAGDLDSFLH